MAATTIAPPIATPLTEVNGALVEPLLTPQVISIDPYKIDKSLAEMTVGYFETGSSVSTDGKWRMSANPTATGKFVSVFYDSRPIAVDVLGTFSTGGKFDINSFRGTISPSIRLMLSDYTAGLPPPAIAAINRMMMKNAAITAVTLDTLQLWFFANSSPTDPNRRQTLGGKTYAKPLSVKGYFTFPHTPEAKDASGKTAKVKMQCGVKIQSRKGKSTQPAQPAQPAQPVSTGPSIDDVIETPIKFDCKPIDTVLRERGREPPFTRRMLNEFLSSGRYLANGRAVLEPFIGSGLSPDLSCCATAAYLNFQLCPFPGRLTTAEQKKADDDSKKLMESLGFHIEDAMNALTKGMEGATLTDPYQPPSQPSPPSQSSPPLPKEDPTVIATDRDGRPTFAIVNPSLPTPTNQ
jgi:hypothetical protein